MMQNYKKQIYILLVFILIVVFLFSALSIFSSIQIKTNDGLLKVTTSDKKSTITVAQVKSNAQYIGTGVSNVFLKPGDYFVNAQANGLSVSNKVTINRGQTTVIKLNLKNQTYLPSIFSVNFVNFPSFLLNSGITSTQKNILARDIFYFKPTAKKIVFDTSSVLSLVPVGLNPNFKVNFNIAIDDTSYKAVASYTSLNKINLNLYSNKGALVLSDY